MNSRSDNLTNDIEDSNINLKYTANLIQLRRNKVMELYAKGYSQNRIAKTLGVSQPLVNADIVYLKEQATTNLATHIHETIPMNYEKCLSGLNQVLQITWELQEKSTDNKEKLQSLSLLKDCYRYLMEMSSDSTTIREAMTFVKERLSKQSEQQSEEKEEEELQEEYEEEEERNYNNE